MISFLAFVAEILLSVLILYVFTTVLSIFRHYRNPISWLPWVPRLQNPILGTAWSRSIKIDSGELVESVVPEEGDDIPFDSVELYYGVLGIGLRHPRWAKHVLMTNASNYKRGRYYGVEGMMLLGGENGILTVSGEIHKRLRKVAASGFRHTIIQASAETISSKAKLLVGRWTATLNDSAQTGEVLIASIKKDLTDYTLDCLGLVGMGQDFQCLTQQTEVGAALLRIVGKAKPSLIGVLPCYMQIIRLLRRIILSDIDLSWMKSMSAGVSLHDIQLVIRFLKRVITSKEEQRWSKMDSSDNSGDENTKANKSPKDLLSQILKSSDAGSLTEDEALELLTAFLLAGTETSSVCLSWSLWLLANNRNIQSLAAAECSEYLQSAHESASLFTWNDINDPNVLPRLKKIIRESLRIYPPVPFIMREPTVDDEIAGYRIPKGTPTIINVAAMHRNPSIWGDDVMRFNPDREFFEDAFLPFGAGSHMCIGYQLATLEILASLTHLLSAFEFRRAPGDRTTDRTVITMAPYPPIQLLVKHRHTCHRCQH